MQPGDLLVQVLGQHVDLADFVVIAVGEQLDLRNRLVGEARRHDEARGPGATAVSYTHLTLPTSDLV